MGAANAINESTTGICGFTGTAFVGTPVTAHDVLVGGSTSSTITNISPSTAGFVLTSNGVSSDPSFQAIPSGGTFVKQTRTISNAAANTTAVIPGDNTIPQNTEGTELMTLAITPSNANNILLIEYTSWCGSVSSATIYALFQDSTADALTTVAYAGVGNTPYGLSAYLRYYMTAGTTSSTTFKIRFGNISASQTNDLAGCNGAARFSTALSRVMTITEYTS